MILPESGAHERVERPAEGGTTLSRQDVSEPPERVCPNCSAVLIERKCKLLCLTFGCGYYMSCSDFF